MFHADERKRIYDDWKTRVAVPTKNVLWLATPTFCAQRFVQLAKALWYSHAALVLHRKVARPLPGVAILEPHTIKTHAPRRFPQLSSGSTCWQHSRRHKRVPRECHCAVALELELESTGQLDQAVRVITAALETPLP